ncbi:carboxylesterase/lipase family protein [Chenggangzhangella methanolivorans]|uniref:Carboxylic ester hydrolase n=1 Tax=Chenggangzhangella methanolivorans TaxID=1437009 RepID=A0A9E6UJJ5_9HYPH|nr:carboxylesterase family protein [Chenggangzhangella methanolivorans]QZO02043.1 carboxylesterase family protein [Chenggangzhangella methanolivorans]
MKALTRCRTLHSLAVGATLAALAVTAGAKSSEAESVDAKAPLVETSDGPVQGIRRHGVYQYLGIPYAAPPVGDLRWRPPQPPKKWAKPLNVGRPGKSCVQSNTLGVFAEPSLEEDCLYLNVVTDDNRNSNGKKNKPVMVWIHGGGWFDGSANEYNSEWLVKRGDVVFVSMNYRLNIFGFFDHPALGGKNAPSGNYGFMDQQLALRWIKENIVNFGGDPHNVTIFGESAGGGSVMAQIVSPAAKGLFHRAIVESGSYVMVSPMQTVDQAHAYAEQFSETVGCGGKSAEETAACLKGLTPKQIVKRGKAFTDTAQAIIDGTTIPASIPEVLGSGKFNKVPVMNGANRDELRWVCLIGGGRKRVMS